MFNFVPVAEAQKIRRVGSMSGDISGYIGWLPPKFECLNCGWRERLVVRAINRKTDVEEVAIIAEALSFKKK